MYSCALLIRKLYSTHLTLKHYLVYVEDIGVQPRQVQHVLGEAGQGELSIRGLGVQRAACSVQRAACSVQRAACSVQ